MEETGWNMVLADTLFAIRAGRSFFDAQAYDQSPKDVFLVIGKDGLNP